MSVSLRGATFIVALAVASATCLSQPDVPGRTAPSVEETTGCGPKYPVVSRRFGETGDVLVKVFVGADGAPSQVQVERSSGFERLDRAAVDAVSCFRFTPASVAGVPRAMWARVPVRFELK